MLFITLNVWLFKEELPFYNKMLMAIPKNREGEFSFRKNWESHSENQYSSTVQIPEAPCWQHSSFDILIFETLKDIEIFKVGKYHFNIRKRNPHPTHFSMDKVYCLARTYDKKASTLNGFEKRNKIVKCFISTKKSFGTMKYKIK